uniref:LIM zinc-binding domain-containing protein n=1 Tax=Meloidogyne enterolobii TaxID=390850 RepID=A0A6V7XFE6_MELEN|nr:unnamed protein product [Meloidogyne enterolobii]
MCPRDLPTGPGWRGLLRFGQLLAPQCFRCEGCSRPLEGGNYYLVDNRPYDLACHWGRRLALQNRNDQL